MYIACSFLQILCFASTKLEGDLNMCNFSPIRIGYEKQIGQIEANNAEMHNKIGGVQAERDAARGEAAQLLAEKHSLEKKYTDLSKSKDHMEKQAAAYKGTISNLEEKLDAEQNQVQTHHETINTLQNNILNLQKQVEGLNETCSKLARDLQGESKLRMETQTQLSRVKQMHLKLEETYCAEKIKMNKLEEEKNQLATKVAAFELEGKPQQTAASEPESNKQHENSDNSSERISYLMNEDQETRTKLLELQSQIKNLEADNLLEKTRSAEQITRLEREKEELITTADSSDIRKTLELQQRVAELESDKKILLEKLSKTTDTVDSPSGNRTTEVVEQTTEIAQANSEYRQTVNDEEVMRLRATLKAKEEEFNIAQQSLKNVQERLRSVILPGLIVMTFVFLL